MDKFADLASSNYRNLVTRSKRSIYNGTGRMDCIMEFKDHSKFKFSHNNHFLWQSKDKVPSSDVNLVMQMQAGRDMEDLRIIFKYMK
jgi:hypothetical protein